jgi:aminopeptidase-like protein
MMNLLAYADGTIDLIDIADQINVAVWEISETIDKLKCNGLLKVL